MRSPGTLTMVRFHSRAASEHGAQPIEHAGPTIMIFAGGLYRRLYIAFIARPVSH